MKIICIGRNYKDHAKELNNPLPDQPVVFCKPDSAILPQGRAFFIPEFDTDIHHEVEVVIKINKLGRHIQKEFAHRYYNEVTVGLDFTARTVQKEQMSMGLPWEIAKGFDGSAVIGKFIPKQDLDLHNLSFHLDINGTTAQKGNTAEMGFDIDTLIAHVSQYFTLKIGDLLFTGTPAGVGPVSPDDQLEGYIEGQKLLDCRVK